MVAVFIKFPNVVDDTSVKKNTDLEKLNKTVDKSPVRCLDKKTEKKMIAVIDQAKENGDSVGGSFEVIANGLPYGLGSYINADGKLQARLHKQ
ncbi:MAG: hypothetical protein CM1200mP1_02380 [Candidatus Neomarinimicrobiota bacterium]|nr:MAG: hypothetical protein CM1200mP1_02380 [Candidatus Neomarinimicrobiota bacterium]